MIQVWGMKITDGSFFPHLALERAGDQQKISSKTNHEDFHSVYFAGVSCNSLPSNAAQGKWVKHKCRQKKEKVEETA